MPMPEAADSGDEAGPVPAKSATAGSSKAAAKRRKVLKYEKVYLDNLPSADRYYSPS
jgi:peptidylprolyl isomerase domain and WD repeat-containing protein 1